MKVSVGVSNRHVHLCEEDLIKLFGEEYKLEVLKPINQVGQFASTALVTIKTEKSEIENVRILGPIRPYTQVEISRTDAYKLGLKPPVRSSGDLVGSSPITIIGPAGSINLKEGCIIADRHIHMTEEEAKEYGFVGKEKVKLLIPGERGGVMHNVVVRIAPNSYYEVHIDTDDANAFMINNGDVLEILDDN